MEAQREAQLIPSAPTHTNGKPVEGPELENLSQSVVEAAMLMDKSGLERILDQSFAHFTPDAVVQSVIEPSAREIGGLWMSGRLSVAGEHMASGAFSLRLRKLLESASPPDHQTPNVICGCFPGENHQLGPLIVAYEVTRRGVRVDFLGASVPFEDLERACEALHPTGMLLSVTRSPLYDAHRPQLLEMLRRRAGSLKFVLGGQGVPEEDAEVTALGVRLCHPGVDVDSLAKYLGS
jgi:methanogenic corrinoid protein MtbC1